MVVSFNWLTWEVFTNCLGTVGLDGPWFMEPWVISIAACFLCSNPYWLCSSHAFLCVYKCYTCILEVCQQEPTNSYSPECGGTFGSLCLLVSNCFYSLRISSSGCCLFLHPDYVFILFLIFHHTAFWMLNANINRYLMLLTPLTIHFID